MRHFTRKLALVSNIPGMIAVAFLTDFADIYLLFSLNNDKSLKLKSTIQHSTKGNQQLFQK